MPNRLRILTVPDADRAELERRARARGEPGRVAERARMVLLAADGLTGPQIAERAGSSGPTVVKWRRQYAEGGPAGLADAPRPGGPKKAAPVQEDQRQPRQHYPAVAVVLPPAAPLRGVHVLHRPAAGREDPRRRRPVPPPAGERCGRLRRREVAGPGLSGGRSGRLVRRTRARYDRFSFPHGQDIWGQPGTEPASANGRPQTLRTPWPGSASGRGAQPASWPRRRCFSGGRARNGSNCGNMSVKPPNPG